MNQRVLAGVAVLGTTLALVGAFVNNEDKVVEVELTSVSSSPVDHNEQVGERSLGNRAVGTPQAKVQVPLRNGLADESGQVDANSKAPISVRIGNIGLEAPILSVGVDSQNQFAVPAADTVGWYKHSSLPGAAGATVLAAHVDYAGRPGAFYNLADLRPGDQIDVVMSDGSVSAYRVTGNSQYDKKQLPAEELFRKDGDSVLQLITCGGSFDPVAQSYRANVVVTATPSDF